MAHIDALLTRNQAFAASGGHRGVTIYPATNTYVITCLDPRVDPAAFLQVGLGDAAVVRNAGGRVSPDTLRELAYICYLSGTKLRAEGPLFEVAVIHHDQCGTHFLADPAFRAPFVDLVGGDDAAWAGMAVVDPELTVRHDVELLLASTLLPPRITVSGHVYDLGTGLVRTVLPAVPHA